MLYAERLLRLRLLRAIVANYLISLSQRSSCSADYSISIVRKVTRHDEWLDALDKSGVLGICVTNTLEFIAHGSLLDLRVTRGFWVGGGPSKALSLIQVFLVMLCPYASDFILRMEE